MTAAKVKQLFHGWGLNSRPSQSSAAAMHWFLFARMGLLYLGLSLMVLRGLIVQPGLPILEVLAGYATLSLLFGVTLLTALSLSFLRVGWRLISVNLVVDAIATSWLLAAMGSQAPAYALIYLVQILVAALTFYQRGAILSALFSSIGFGVVSYSLSATNQDALVIWGINSGIFATLGFVGGFLSEELRRTSHRLENLTAQQEEILSGLPTGLLAVDGEMRVLYVNPGGANILHRSITDIVGKEVKEIEIGLLPFFQKLPPVPVRSPTAVWLAGESPEFNQAVTASGGALQRSFYVKSTTDGEHQARLQQTVEFGTGANRRVIRGDVAEFAQGGHFGQLSFSGSEPARVLTFQDVTKLHHLEEKLKQHEKLAAVGQLAAGIAHEIRNPLAGMSGSIEMLRETLPQGPDFQQNRKLLDIAIREIDRLNGLISEFLDFVKPENLRLSAVDLSGLLNEIVFSFRNSREFRTSLTLELEVSSGVQVRGNPEKLRQIALNLLLNAAQAVVANGTIRVGCSHLSDQVAKFWIADNGVGMSEEVKAHLYEPFFTTKEKGTGLGLATVYKLVEAHHGEINVESELGSGTRFEVFLPRWS